MKKKGRILVVDDNKNVLTALDLLLSSKYESVTLLSSPKTLLSTIAREQPDVILLDMNFSTGINTGNEGLYWLDEVKKRYPKLPMVLFTAYADIQLAVNALKRGANDFVVKPWNNNELIESLEVAMAMQKGEKQSLPEKQAREQYLGESKSMQRILDLALKTAKTDANVLITGENGSGKGVLAHFILENSLRNHAPMITVDMGALTPSLFESEMFGHVKGSFTDAKSDRKGKFVEADAATIFLDEIGNLDLSLQAKLLTALQSRTVTPVGSNSPIQFDTRIIAASNCNIEQRVQEGSFREDLYYRLNTIHLEMPPLREREEDILELAKLFANKYAEQYDKEFAGFHESAQDAMLRYPWPGNVRELEHCIEKAMILSNDSLISARDLMLTQSVAPTDQSKAPRSESSQMVNTTLEEMEKSMIIAALDRNGSNLSQVASELGISRQTLYNKLKKYGL